MRFRQRRRAPTAPVAPVPRRSPPSVPATVPPDLADLEDQARYQRDLLALYRARMHGAYPTSVERLHDLERAATAADERLRAARRLTVASGRVISRPTGGEHGTLTGSELSDVDLILTVGELDAAASGRDEVAVPPGVESALLPLDANT